MFILAQELTGGGDHGDGGNAPDPTWMVFAGPVRQNSPLASNSKSPSTSVSTSPSSYEVLILRRPQSCPARQGGSTRSRASPSSLARSRSHRSRLRSHILLVGIQIWRGFRTPVEMEEWGIPLSPRCQSSSLEASRITANKTIVPYERRYVPVRSCGEIGE